MLRHSYHLRHDRNPGPFNTKRFCELPEIDGSRFPDAINGISQPRHTQGAQLIVKELLPELSCKEWHVLDNSLSHAP